MGLVNDLIRTGGQVVNAVSGTAARVVNQVQQTVVRPAVQTVQTVQRVAAPVVTQANSYVNQAARYVAPAVQTVQRVAPITQVMTNPISGAARIAGTTAARVVPQYINQAARSIAPTIRTVQRVAPIALTAANPMAAVGRTVGINAVRTVTPYIQQASRSIAPTVRTVQRVAPIALTAANPMAAVGRTVGINAVKTVTPYIQQASRSIAPTIRTVQRVAPIALTAANPIAAVGRTVGMVAGKSVTPGIQQAANTFGQISTSILRNPTQAITPAIKTIQRSAPIALAISNPMAAVGKVVGGVVAKSATPYIKQTGTLFAQASNSFIRNPVQTVLPVVRTVQQIAPISRRITNPIAGAGALIGMATAKAVTPVLKQTGALFKSNSSTARAAGNFTKGLFPTMALTSTLGGGDQKIWQNSSWEASSINQNGTISKSGGWTKNWTVQGNTTSKKPVAETVKDPGDGSTDALGRLGRGDIIGAIGAGGKWLTTNVPPAAEATGNWFINGPQNFVNLQAGHLERGEIPIFKQVDEQILKTRNKVISGNSYLTELERGTPKESPYTGPFSGAGTLMRDLNTDILGTLNVNLVGGVVGGTKFLGNVGGKLFNRDLIGAGTVVAEGGYNAATGLVNSVVQIPGRLVADPKHAPGQILAEYASGEILFRGVGKAAKGAKAGATPLGEATGLVRAKTFGFEHIPYKSTGAQVLDVLNNEKSYNVARAVSSPSITLERVPGKILPRASVLIRDPGSLGDTAAGAKGLFVTKGSQYLESYGKYFLTKKRGVTGRIFGGHVDVIPEVYNVQLPTTLKGQIEQSIKSKGNFLEYYPEVVKLAKEQSIAKNQPIAVPSPKRGIGHAQPESELFLVFGNKASQQITKTQFAGFAPRSLTRVKKIALGSQELKSTRIGNISENLKYNWDIGRSGTKFYNKNYLRAMSDDMTVKYNELYGGRLAYPGQYGNHGQEHATAVSNNLITMRRTSPTLQGAAPENELRARGTYHDIAKIADPETEPYKHGFATAEAIRTGTFTTPELRAMSPAARKALARDIELHTRIDPRPYTFRGIRTAIIDRPSVTAKALANADRMDLVRFGTKVKSRQLFTLPMGSSTSQGGIKTDWLNLGNDGVLFPGRSRVKTTANSRGSTVKPQIDTLLGEVRGRIGNKGKTGSAEYSGPLVQSSIRPKSILDLGINSKAYDQYGSISTRHIPQISDYNPAYNLAGEGGSLNPTRRSTEPYSPQKTEGSYSNLNKNSTYRPVSKIDYPGVIKADYGPIYKTEYPKKYSIISTGDGKYATQTENRYNGDYNKEKTYSTTGKYTKPYSQSGKYGSQYKGEYGTPGRYVPRGQYKSKYGSQGGYSYGGNYKSGYGSQGGYSYGGNYKSGYGSQGGYAYGGDYTGKGSSQTWYSYIDQPGGGGGFKFDYGYNNYARGGWGNSIPPQNPQEEIRGQRHGGIAAYDFYEVSGITDPDAIFAAAKKAPKSKKNRFPSLSPKTISIAKTTGKGKKIFGVPKIKRKRLF